jgi:YVTN family beta-propeller protein
VASAGSDEVLIIDAFSRRVIRRVRLSFGDEPSRVLLSPDEQVAYVLSYGSNVLSILDARSLLEISRIAVEDAPRGLAVDPETGYVYVAGELTGNVTAYDPELGSEVMSIALGSSPAELLFPGEVRKLYVGSASQRRLTCLDLESQSSVGRLNLCAPAQGLAFNPLSRRLYAAIGDCHEIAVFLPERELDFGTIPLPDRPGLLTMDSDGQALIVALPSADQIVFVNANSRRLDGVVNVGERPYMVVIP